MRARILGTVAVVLLAALSACGGNDQGGSDDEVTLKVFAAASLTESFTSLGKTFEKDHPGTTVTFQFGPSSGLAEQIGSGAPADVFAAASTTPMDDVVGNGDAKDPQDFARNRAEIALPPDNPGQVSELKDLARSGLKVALCQAQVPCGKVAAEVFEKAGLTVKPATEEADVKAVLTKVTLGEVDAGVVYVTDVLAAGDKVTGVEIPADQNAETTYPIATLKDSEHAKLAGQFVELVLSDAGQDALRKAGFEQP